MNGVAVDGVRRRGTQALVLKLPALKVEGDKIAALGPTPTVILVAEALFEAFDIGLGHGVDEVHLAGAQRRQADRVLALDFDDDFVQVR
jgi:hypothetical protein